MAVLSWGKPKIFIKDLDADTPVWKLMPESAEDTTSLETTKGEKVEAKLEGGENQDVRYKRNTYALATSIRIAKGTTQPIAASDGLVTHNYAVVVQPEDTSCIGFVIPKAEVSVEESWTAADGGTWVYTFDALKPQSGNQVEWGTVVATAGSGSSADTYTITVGGTSV